MISWRSFTTSKVLPTFVGESWRSSSGSGTGSAATGFDYRGWFFGERSGSGSSSEYQDRTRSEAKTENKITVAYYSAGKDASGNIIYNGTAASQYDFVAEEGFGFDGLQSYTSVNGRSTFIHNPFYTFDDNGNAGVSRPTATLTSPLARITQETTTTESYERQIRKTKTISAYGDEEGGEGAPIEAYVWATTTVGSTFANGDTTQVKSVTQVTTQTTETVVDYVTENSERTIITTNPDTIAVETYTHIDGDVVVVANTIWEGRMAATFDSPLTDTLVVTELSFAPTRFTVSFSEEYTSTLSVRDDSLRTTTANTTQATKTGHQTTRTGYTQDSYKVWYEDYETRTCENRTGFTVYTERDDEGNIVEYTSFDAVNRLVPVSFQINAQSTFEEETQVSTTTTTTETYLGHGTYLNTRGYSSYTDIMGNIGDDGNYISPIQPRNVTFYPENTVSEETTTFFISGDLTKSSSITWPGILYKQVFPYTSTGDGHRRYFNLPNSETTLVSTTSRLITFGHTYNIVNNGTTINTYPATTYDPIFNRDIYGPGGATDEAEWAMAKTGEFYNKIDAGQVSVFDRSAFWFGPNFNTVVCVEQYVDYRGDLASPELTYKTENTHSTVGVFMTADAEHTWEEIGEAGLISQGVVGAIPLYPTFTGIISNDSEGWELCDTSEYTSVSGSRIGAQFTTTIAWQTVSSGTITIVTTSSGEFTVDSTSSASHGFRTQQGQTIAGGFQTPNAAYTRVVRRAALSTITYDASNSGTGTTFVSTGTIEKSAPVGAVPITLSSVLMRVQGYGVFTQALLDEGMP
jgi:hypothetical protein